MKFDWLITFRSVTFAQRGEKALHRIGIDCSLQRTPKELSNKGCGYCLRLQGKNALAAVEILRDQQISFGKIYAVIAGGRMEERLL